MCIGYKKVLIGLSHHNSQPIHWFFDKDFIMFMKYIITQTLMKFELENIFGSSIFFFIYLNENYDLYENIFYKIKNSFLLSYKE